MAYIERILKGWAVKNGRTGAVVKVVDRADQAAFYAAEFAVESDPAANHSGDDARLRWRQEREAVFAKLLEEASLAELDAFAAMILCRDFDPDAPPALCPECRTFFDSQASMRELEDIEGSPPDPEQCPICGAPIAADGHCSGLVCHSAERRRMRETDPSDEK